MYPKLEVVKEDPKDLSNEKYQNKVSSTNSGLFSHEEKSSNTKKLRSLLVEKDPKDSSN